MVCMDMRCGDMVPVHPESCPDHSDRLRWITPPGVLPFVGRVAMLPRPLRDLLDEGVLVEVTAEPGAVLTQLGPGRSWSQDGPRVRTALHAALAEPDDWAPVSRVDGPAVSTADGGGECDDEALRAVAREVLGGPVGQMARTHGGSIDLVDVRDGVVEVRLRGACDGCPAARTTIHVRLEHQIRQRYGGLRAVRDVGRPPSRFLTEVVSTTPAVRRWRRKVSL